MKIVHFTVDEKFINGAMSTFELAFPNQNELYLLKPKSNPVTKYINAKYITKEFVYTNKILKKYQSLAKKADWVVIHGMNQTWANLMLTIGTKKFINVVWGAEVYDNPFLYKKETLGSETMRLKNSNSNVDLREGIKNILNSIGYKKYKSKKNIQKLIKKAYGETQNLAMLYEEEFKIYVDNNILLKSVNFLKFGYYPIEYFAKNLNINATLGDNILVGNSSSYTNNHLEIFKKLSHLSIGDKKLIVPLSYGDPILRQQLIKGNKVFNTNFFPILKFLPLGEYNKLIQSCNIVIMNHYRQQAVGNIISAVYIGAKVFLNTENSAYLYLKNLGCHIYNIEKDLNNDEGLKGLSQKQIEHNRFLLEKDINQKQLADNLISFLKN
jgi:hypothetical protein